MQLNMTRVQRIVAPLEHRISYGMGHVQCYLRSFALVRLDLQI